MTDSRASAVTLAVTFLWLGHVLAISFIEAPLRFRAPGVTTRLGLGFGRLVFRALNTLEVMLAALILVAVIVGPVPAAAAPIAIAIMILLAQVVLVRPSLTRHSDRILAGADMPRSRGHHLYIALETLKALALLTGGLLLITG